MTTPKKKKTIKPDGYTGAARTQVGRVNRKVGKKKNGDRTTFEHSVNSDYIKSLTSLQKRIRDDMKGTKTAKEFESDIAFEKKRRAAAKKKVVAKKPVKKVVKKAVKKK